MIDPNIKKHTLVGHLLSQKMKQPILFTHSFRVVPVRIQGLVQKLYGIEYELQGKQAQTNGEKQTKNPNGKSDYTDSDFGFRIVKGIE